ncbi:hypothetical protein GIB67_002816 [Kingdonia uniflora]|uniref:EF-hand domain-containing protein n=1 Tax=Kingdonia uniflora TaxID=39325 RepID=A0A7J7M5I0_9MAGN|nr:hypothetical protein GIB67_002816 [Kingdonia uniflora]
MMFEDLRRVFSYCDENGDGKISPEELQHCVAVISGHKGELSRKEVEELVKSLDTDGDGFLGIEDFVGLIEVKSEDENVKDLKEAFEMYVMDGCEFITPMSLKRILGRLGESKTVEECGLMIKQFDLDRDGVLNFDEFRIMMQ